MEQTKEAASKKMLYSVEFEMFWKNYPRRIAKLHAFKAYTKSTKMGVTHEEIIDGARKYSEWCESTGRSEQYIKHASTWLAGGCWEDELSNPKFDQSREKNGTGCYRQGAKSRGEIVAELINNIQRPESMEERGIYRGQNNSSDNREIRPSLFAGTLSRH